MSATPTTRGIYLNVLAADWTLLSELIRRFGWQTRTREDMLDAFIRSRPASLALTEEEIVDEVRQARRAASI